MSFILNFMGMHELHPDTENLMRKYGFFRVFRSMLYALTGTIFALFLIDGVGFFKTAQFMAVMVFVQLIIDYPSGTLGDYIGQRWVLFIANLSSGIGLLIFAFAPTYTVFIISAILFGFANAQASGALQSWLDNNYKLIAGKEDSERKNYGFTMARIGTMETFAMGTFIVIGGITATAISREFMFTLQAFLTVVMAFIYLRYLTNYGEITNHKSQNFKEYFGVLSQGVRVAVSSKSIFLFLMGNAIMFSVWDLWGSLLLFPVYFSYSGSDSMAGILRSTIFFIGVLVSIKMANVARKMDNNKLPKYLFLHVFSLFTLIMAVLYFIPPTNQFNLVGFIVLIFVFTLSVSLLAPIINTLIQRVMVDLIPSEQRNAIYSLIPTLSGPFRIFILPFTGALIEAQGLIAGVALVLGVSMVPVFFIFLALRSKTDDIVKIPTQEVSPGIPG